MIEITPDIAIDENEIKEEFIRSSGPGGQNVNKVATAVQLRFDAAGSTSIPDHVRQRLMKLAGKQVNNEGILIIDARRFRSQEQNRRDALERLKKLIRRAAKRPKIRKKTRPTAASVARRLDAKRHRREIKKLRHPPRTIDD
jgi:ribosome-associated protein